MKKTLLIPAIFAIQLLLPSFGYSQIACEVVLQTELSPASNERGFLNELLRQDRDRESLADRQAAETLYNEMTNLEKQLQRREFWNGNATRVSLHQIRSRMRRMVLALRTQEPHIIMNQYRDVFRDAEMSYFKITQAEARLQELKRQPLSNQAEVSAVEAEIARQSEIFGRHYTEYTQVRRVLEAIRDKNASVIENYNISVSNRAAERVQTEVQISPEQQPQSQGAKDQQMIENTERAMNLTNFDSLNTIDLGNHKVVETAEYVLSRMGLNEVRTSYPELFPTTMDAATLNRLMSLSEVQKYYREHPRVIISKLRHDLKNEGTLVYKAVSYAFLTSLNSVRSLINRLPAGWSRALFWVTGLVRDQYLLDVYLDKVERVLTMTGTVKNKLDLLRDLSAISPNDEMLVTFARIAIFTEGWVQLKETARVLGENSDIYKSFYERMTTVEETVRSQGHLSLYGRRVYSVEGPVFVIALGSGVYEFWPQIQQSMQFLASFVGLGG